MSEASIKPLVLLVAQSPLTVKSISKLLSQYFNIISVSDAQAAWEHLLESAEAAVVICELQLSIDKFGFLERLRSAGNNRLAAKPVLLLVGETNTEENRESAFHQGATDFINMPFSSTELTTRVRLHAQFFVQHSQSQPVEIQQDTSLSVLQQLSQENYFESRLNQELAFSLRHKISVGICKIKMSNINELVAEKGKPATVALVQAVATIIKDTMRSEDTLCYLGKAEFNLLFPATNGIGSATGLRRIMDSVTKQNIQIAGEVLTVKLAAAVYSCVPTSNTTIEAVTEVLQRRLKEALAQGGDRSIVTSAKADESIAITVERALQMIERGDVKGLPQHLRALMTDILPLIEYADGELDLGLHEADFNLRQKILTK